MANINRCVKYVFPGLCTIEQKMLIDRSLTQLSINLTVQLGKHPEPIISHTLFGVCFMYHQCSRTLKLAVFTLLNKASISAIKNLNSSAFQNLKKQFGNRGFNAW